MGRGREGTEGGVRVEGGTERVGKGEGKGGERRETVGRGEGGE